MRTPVRQRVTESGRLLSGGTGRGAGTSLDVTGAAGAGRPSYIQYGHNPGRACYESRVASATTSAHTAFSLRRPARACALSCS